MSENQKSLIKKYFNSLVNQFITDPEHKKDITIVFKDCIGGSIHGDVSGRTEHERTGGHWNWETLNGVEVPGSRWQEPYKYTYTISFLNNYRNEDEFRGAVCHEFSHLYLFYKGNYNHNHDDAFYSEMDRFENWLDRYYGLSPRKDKGGDWNQHVDYNKREQRKNQYPSQPRNNDNNYSPQPSYRDTPKEKEKDEWSRLTDLIRNAKTLTELENNWQTVKNSPLYDSNKKTWDKYDKNNKERLDSCYATYKRGFCTNCLNDKENHQSNCSEKCSKCSHSRLRNDTEKCHNSNCENYCFDPKWDQERGERNNSNLSDVLSSEERDEYNRLARLIKSSKNLTELEQNYQTVKNSSIYSSGKRYCSNDKEDVKTEFDEHYNAEKNRFQSPNSNNPTSNPTPPNSIKKYFLKNNVKRITLQGEKWLIEYNNKKKQTTIPLNNPDFQSLKDYLKNSNKSSLSREELDIYSEKSWGYRKPTKNDYSWVPPLLLVLGLGVAVFFLIFKTFSVRRRKKFKK